jgi:uncharacterized damage-inducible protein DinB
MRSVGGAKRRTRAASATFANSACCVSLWRCGQAFIQPFACWRSLAPATYNPGVYDADTLTDIHQRAHESLRRLIAFCGELTEEAVRQPLPGFGFATILDQLAHVIGAEVYWQTVVIRGYTEEADLPALPNLIAIEAFRERTAAATRAYLAGAAATELNARREMISDPGVTRVLRPADVLMRVVTHIFNHQGQVLAMCRTLGQPNQRHDLDYPVD